MIINLRDWVNREVISLRNDIAKHVPHLDDDPNYQGLLKRVEEQKLALFDLLRSILDRSEVEAKKVKKPETTKESTEIYGGFDG
jgi:hypothetical protein